MALRLDPFRPWRETLTKLEDELNALANVNMSTPRFTRALHRYTRAMIGMQELIEKVLASTLAAFELPSRSELRDLATTLRRVEDKLDRLLPVETHAPIGRGPARTRVPSEGASAALAAPPRRHKPERARS